MPDYKPTVALDFDGVLHSYTSGWTGVTPTDPPVPGAQEFCRRLQAEGYKVVIVTTRAREPRVSDEEPGGAALVAKWLFAHDFPDGMKVTCEKVPAVAYVDDRAVYFDTATAMDATPIGRELQQSPSSNHWDDVMGSVLELAHRSHGAARK